MGRFYGYKSSAFGIPIGPAPGMPSGGGAPSMPGGAPGVVAGKAMPGMLSPGAMTPAQAIVSAPTPKAAAAAAAPATVPIVRTEAKVSPGSIPPPAALAPSAPAAFAPFTIRPEVIGAPVNKGIVPGMYDHGTVTSLFPGLTAAAPIDKTPPTTPSGAASIGPPSTPTDIFNSHAAVKTAQAMMLDQIAQTHADVATDLAHKADQAIHAANEAGSRATMDPSFDAQAAAAAAAQRAKNAIDKASVAADRANALDAQANAKAAQAQAAIDHAAAAAAAHDLAQQAAIDHADNKAVQNLIDTPGQAVPPSWFGPTDGGDGGGPVPSPIPGSLVPGVQFGPAPKKPVSPVVAAGGLGVVGFFLGGPVGALIGAVLGGGGAMYLGKSASPQAPIAWETPPFPGAPPPHDMMGAQPGWDPYAAARDASGNVRTDDHGNPIDANGNPIPIIVS